MMPNFQEYRIIKFSRETERVKGRLETRELDAGYFSA